MCTLTYIPTGDHGFLLTSNRDEAPFRAARELSRQRAKGEELLFPRDTGAGGTWLALSDRGRVACLINGAFQRHRHEPPYRRSRGLMVLDYYEFSATQAFLQEYSFSGMEPFTLILVEADRLWDIRWDGQRLHTQRPDPSRYHIWSSPVLYDPVWQKKRAQWFANWLESRRGKVHDRESILNFHLTAGEGDPENDLVMNRQGMVRTTSVSSVSKSNDRLELKHIDLLKNEIHEHDLEIDAPRVSLTSPGVYR